MNTMAKTKKPDNVVYNEDSQSYDASLKAYGTDLGAPSITTPDTAAWKNRNIAKVNSHIKTKYLELKKEFDAIIEEYEYNNLVYNAKFNFEPVVGEIYHLYKDNADQPFLSIISPQECSFNFVGSFYLSADGIWKKSNS